MWAEDTRRRRLHVSPLSLLLIVLSTATILLFFASKRLIDEAERLEQPYGIPSDINKLLLRPRTAINGVTNTSSEGLTAPNSEVVEEQELIINEQSTIPDSKSLKDEITKRLKSRLKAEETTATKPLEHRMIICSKIGNEIPYLPEWIEFHRIQGFTKFVFYVDDIPTEKLRRPTTNQVVALRSLYEEIGDRDLIDIHTLTPIFESEIIEIVDPIKYAKPTTPLHRLSQQSLLKHCWENYRARTEWIAHIDVDEFIYAPKHPSIAAFMASLYDVDPRNEKPGSFIPAYQYGNLSGTYLWPINYGMSTDSILSPRVALRSSPMNGRTELLFDPAYRNAKTPEQAQQEKRHLDNFLSWLSQVQSDVKVTSSTSVRNFFEALLRQESRRYEAYNLYDSYMDLSLAGPSLADMRHFFQHYYDEVAKDFFLVTDGQRHRMTNVDYGDSYDIVYDSMIQAYPYCATYLNELRKEENSNLRPKMAKHEREAKLGRPDHNECIPGELPTQITNVGKTLFWTGLRFEPPANWSRKQAYERAPHPHRRRPRHEKRLDSDSEKPTLCVLPWVHHCAHKSWAPIVLADMHQHLRLDHHMTRSIESRTISDSEWRVLQGKLGKFVEHQRLDFSVLRFVSAYRDDSKARFIPELRKRIARLKPTPMASTVSMPPHQLKYETTWKDTSCQLIDLLQRRQSMCPASHKYAGILGHHIPPPIGMQPYGFCTESLGTFRAKIARSAVDDDELQHCVSEFEPSRCDNLMRFLYSSHDLNDTSFCPDWPRSPCCDHDPALYPIMLDTFERFNVIEEYRKAESRNLTLLDWRRTTLLNMLGQY